MDLKIHASKLPTRKTRKAARESTRVRVENNRGCLEQLKNIGFSSASDGTVAFRRGKTKTAFPKQSKKSSSGTKLAEKGRKRLIFEERIERRMVKSDLQVTFCFAVKVQVETPEHLDLLNF